MVKTRWIAIAALAALALTNATKPPPAAAAQASTIGHNQPLSVMTFNIKGLPFPVAYDRTPALSTIGTKLADLRARGMQPHVVLLQEAFSPSAKALAEIAGYRHVATGPQPGDVKASADAAPSTSFLGQASWLKGETEGKWVDSGLVIMSDYPIVKTARMAFPEDACAGYDCLAAKGVVVAWIKVPGRDQPVAIADTHLNARRASGVSPDRANIAFARQVEAERRFIADVVGPGTSLILGGDFNIGHDSRRIADVAADGGIIPGAREAIAQLGSPGTYGQIGPDLAAVRQRAKDRQYFRPGARQTLRLETVSVPFGIENGGNDLSDHLGFVAAYALR